MSSPPTAPAAIVLAAGEGRRMGGPKALLLVEGQPLIRLHLERLAEVGCRTVAVVVRPETAPLVTELLKAERAPTLVQVIAARTPSPSGSLAMGLRALHAMDSEEVRSLLVTPVDLLPPRALTLRRLLTELERGALAASPRHQGHGGHPVALRTELCMPYLEGAGELDALPPLREVLERAGPRRVRVEVDDRAVLGDFDTPADLSMFGGVNPQFFADRRL